VGKIFQSDEAVKELEEWYQLFLKKIEAPTESLEVQTTHGANHILKVGDQTKPPILCLHSMLTSSAHLASELQLLLTHYHIIAPDLPGQSVRGLKIRFSYKDDSFANWLLEIVNGLYLNKIDLLGISLGGFAALQFANVHSEMVKNLILIVPAGIVKGSMWEGVRKMMLPAIFYRLNPTEERLKKFVDPLMSTWDDDWGTYIGKSFMLFKPDFRVPPLISGKDLVEWDIPTMVFAAEDDISFPGEPMIQKIKENNPDIYRELMRDTKHSPPTTPEFREWLATKILNFTKDRHRLESEK
jgi:pimeloyl-ACP methyl ester carboxylesterase